MVYSCVKRTFIDSFFAFHYKLAISGVRNERWVGDDEGYKDYTLFNYYYHSSYSNLVALNIAYFGCA